MDEGWLAYVGTRGTQIRLNTEKVTRIGGEVRPATKKEITEEKARRKSVEDRREALRVFDARSEVIAARRIRDSIELELEKVIDRLDPDEWAALLKRLED